MMAVDKLAEAISRGDTSIDQALIDDAARNGISIFYFNGKSITNKKEFFKAAKDVMRLPSYFGENWDAFEECISDLSWLNSTGYIFIYDYTSCFFSGNPRDEFILKDILLAARINHEQEGVPFEFILASERL